MYEEVQKNPTNILKFVHITDTHLLNHHDATFHGLNTKKSFEAVLSACQTDYPDIDFLLMTGDISQTGGEESYAIFKSVIQQCKVPIYCIPGNHDTPKFLCKVIPSCPDNSINVIRFDGFSLLLINSWVENKHHGMITQRCLLQLEDHLKNNQDQFTIIAVHHPPIAINNKWLDKLGLQNKTEFLQVIHQYHQDTLVLFGHIHQEIDRQLDKLRLLSTPSTCHQFKANCETMHRVDTSLPAYRFIKLLPPNNIETKIHYIR